MSVLYWEGFWWVFFHLSKGDPSSSSGVAISLWMTRRKSYCLLQHHQLHGNLCTHKLMWVCRSAPFFFSVPILDTVFRLRGECWQVGLMMCWKAIKWRKRMTNLWWQKQNEDNVPDPLSSILRIIHKPLKDKRRAGKGLLTQEGIKRWQSKKRRMTHWRQCERKRLNNFLKLLIHFWNEGVLTITVNC